ncbi:MAG: anhydro-N-acetylmuramic acid kinase [Cellvibrionaceae bacterium]
MSQTYTIGLLSGTSVDAIDAILIQWNGDTPQVVSTYSHEIPSKTKDIVFKLALNGEKEIEQIRYLDQEFALLFSQSAQALCQASNIQAKEIKAIGSHGQTIRHYPPEEGEPEGKGANNSLGFSLQLGDPNIIAETTGITTVADFRRRDIAAGGHGAPLAPAFHKVLFQSNNIDRIILNTGGIANITYLPADGSVIGFDTGPANGLMDSWCQLHQNKAYDQSGSWASKGKVQQLVLDKLLEHPYFPLLPPKSTGREDFNLPWLQNQLTSLGQTFSAVDIQASLSEFSTESIARAIELTTKGGNYEIYICGGGAHNHNFCNRLQKRLKPKQFASTEALGMHPDWVEASCFAWLAKQTIEGKKSSLPSVTGASKEVILGGIYLA